MKILSKNEAMVVANLVSAGYTYADAVAMVQGKSKTAVRKPAMKGNPAPKQKGAKGNPTPTRKPAPVSAKKSFKDFAPVVSADGGYNYKSYNANRTKYSYYKATGGKCTSAKECRAKGIRFNEIETDYFKAKEAFEKHFGEYVAR